MRQKFANNSIGFALVDLVSEPSDSLVGGKFDETERRYRASKSILLELATFVWPPTIPGR
ncbi:MAG TPA: hypothetical protein VI094_20510 [Propionibacteriaceae bacterium]